MRGLGWPLRGNTLDKLFVSRLAGWQVGRQATFLVPIFRRRLADVVKMRAPKRYVLIYTRSYPPCHLHTRRFKAFLFAFGRNARSIFPPQSLWAHHAQVALALFINVARPFCKSFRLKKRSCSARPCDAARARAGKPGEP